ncbi:glycine zipper 2TM domain-containing protein [Massilia cavernae]|uniref:Glycine zipper 2TM domain-containing protein n=1 Tax=Massilia cavernae TaxID=2320864 RepID=A0A418Y6S7_9BURK|nr:glycine zipper 2TM domain-containing protein [Massilia cavernae]RJG23889.1 glycine zipper 2TM domain-containing protein [Massilia cavernae]
MESIKTATRIHPLMAAAALSVITVSIAGTAAITGLLPTSKADAPAAQVAPVAAAPAGFTPAPAATIPAGYVAAPVAGAQTAYVAVPVAAAAPLPAAVRTAAPKRLAAYDDEPAKPKARPRPQPRPVHREPEYTRVASNDAPTYHAPAVQQQQPATPNYVGIGAGAVIGGLLGNQVGSGNGKKLATLAGIIGGGMIGNEIQNRTK